MSKKAAPVKVKKKAPKKNTSKTHNKSAPHAKEHESFLGYMFANLVYWLTNPKRLSANHKLLDRDALIKSEGLHRPSVIDLQERYLDTHKAKLNKPFVYTTDTTRLVKGVKPFKYNMVVTEAIPIRIFRLGNLTGDDIRKYSYGHFDLLNRMLHIVDTRFHDFVDVLNEAMKNRNATKNKDADPLSRSATNLRELLSLLKKSRDGYTGILLPDLFNVDHKSAMMTHDLNFFKSQETDKKKFSHLFTYMYSRETSQAFCATLMELLEKKMKNLEEELNSSKKNPLSELTVTKWLSALPKNNTKTRMKMSLEILGVRNEDGKNEKKVSWTAGDLIFIYRALEQCGAIIPGVKKNKIAVALEILTGKSHLKYLNNYVSAKEINFDFSKVFEIKEDAPSRESIHRLVAKIKNALDNLLKEIK